MADHARTKSVRPGKKKADLPCIFNKLTWWPNFCMAKRNPFPTTG